MTADTNIKPKAAVNADHAADSPVTETTAGRRVCVLIMGMHRSGSSAITRMLSLLGCTLPNTPMPIAFDNPRGHWESQRVADFNDEVLGLAGTQWDDWLPVNRRLSETLIWPQLVARGRDVLREEFGDAPLFVLKDPRICKLGGFWFEVLAAEGIEAAVVLPLRNPLEVAQSLSMRDGMEEHQALLIWLRHALAAEAASRGRPRVFTDYTKLLDNWEELSVRLSDGLGVVWPRVSVSSDTEITQFLSPDLRHHFSKTAELQRNPTVSPWVAKTYEVLLGWANDGEKPADYAILDRISREFDEAGIAFARPMLSASKAVARAKQADAERTALTVERDAAVGQVSEIEARLHQAGIDRDARTAERDGYDHERVALTQHRDALAGRLGEVEAELAQARATIDTTIAERDDLAGRHTALGDEHHQAIARQGEMTAELAHSQAERDIVIAERDRAVAELATQSTERDTVAWRLGEVEAQLAGALEERYALSEARDRLVHERDDLAEDRSKIAWRLGEVDADLVRANARSEDLHAQISGLEDALRCDRTGADELKHRMAVTESTLRQREEEIAQLGNEVTANQLAATEHATVLSRMKLELDHAESARQAAEDRAVQGDAEQRALGIQLAERFAELAEITKMLRAKDGILADSRLDQIALEARLKTRFAEIAQLTEFYQEQKDHAEEQRMRLDWLRRIYAVLQRTPRWWGILPEHWRNTYEMGRLRRKGLFDADAYVASYPDVASSPMSPLRHYILHGIAEGRSINTGTEGSNGS